MAQIKFIRGTKAQYDALIGNADKADFPLFFRLCHALVQAGSVPGFGAEIGIVELKDVEIIRLQQGKACLQILPEALRRFAGGFAGQDNLAAHILQGVPHLFLTVRIDAGRIKKADTVPIRFAQQESRLLFSDPLNGQTAKTVFVHRNAGSSQCNRCHGTVLLSVCSYASFFNSVRAAESLYR